MVIVESAAIVWLIQPDTPSCPVQVQHPDRLLACPRPPAQMALASAQSCSKMTQLHHLQQLRKQLPRRSQWPKRQQALLGVPRLGILLSGQDRLLGLSFQGPSHLLLAGDHPHPLPPLALFHHTITISPLCPALIQKHTWSCRLTHITQDHFTLHTQPFPIPNTSKTIHFEPLEQFRQLHWGWIHLAAPALCCQAGTTTPRPLNFSCMQPH